MSCIIRRSIYSIFKIIRLTLRCLVVVLFTLFATTSLLWGAWATALSSALVIIGASRKRSRLLTLGILSNLLHSPLTIHTVDNEFQRLETAILGDGPEALSSLELAQIFAGNLSMSVVGCAMTFCEAAAETALMSIPWMPKEAVLDSAFPWSSSSWLRREITAHAAATRRGGGEIS